MTNVILSFAYDLFGSFSLSRPIRGVFIFSSDNSCVLARFLPSIIPLLRQVFFDQDRVIALHVDEDEEFVQTRVIPYVPLARTVRFFPLFRRSIEQRDDEQVGFARIFEQKLFPGQFPGQIYLNGVRMDSVISLWNFPA